MIKVDDDSVENSVKYIDCEKCKNYVRDHKCRAFPSGIPNDILTGAFDHRQSYEGDNGIRFEPSTDKE